MVAIKTNGMTRRVKQLEDWLCDCGKQAGHTYSCGVCGGRRPSSK